MDKRKLLVFLLLFLLIGLGLFLLLKSRKPTEVNRIYTNEKVTESAPGKLVEGFPDIPVYNGFNLDKSYSREQSGKKDFSAFWYYNLPENQVPEIYKWYVDELKKKGWKVEGPFVDESENELAITAENSKFKLRLYNSERYEGDSAGKPGKLFSVTLVEK